MSEVGVCHLLQKHVGSRNPNDSYRNVKITRSKDEAIANIENFKAQIKSAEDFKNLAAQYSECRSAANGGDLGMFGAGQMQKPFEDASFGLEVGAISDLVDTDSGIHIIYRYA